MSDPTRYSDDDLDALFARARGAGPDTSAAEYGFETRLMAKLRARRATGSMPVLGALSWRLMPAFAVIVLVLAFWHERVAADARDAEQITCLRNMDGAGLGYNLD
jgi:hypothetical protein